ncbi:MAG: hypothetical protein WKG00_32645 [Polyangiaceae bacterium]
MGGDGRRGGRDSAALALTLALALGSGLGATGCFDSNWGQTKASQERLARHHAAGHLRPTDDGGGRSETRRLKVRVWATPKHIAEVAEWNRRFEESVNDATAVLGPTLGVRLEVISWKQWVPRGPEDDLVPLVDELAASDPGDDVDRVVALAGSVPRFETSFHNLGMSAVLGKHIVMRAMNDAREYEAIEKGFDELDREERVKLYRERRRHKRSAVFLHELAHNWGVPHEVDSGSIMFKAYDPQSESFSPAAVGLMRLSVLREAHRTPEGDAAFAAGFVTQLDRTSAQWVPAERVEMVQRLEAYRKTSAQNAAPKPGTSGASAAASPATGPGAGAGAGAGAAGSVGPGPGGTAVGAATSGGAGAAPAAANPINPTDRATMDAALKLYSAGDPQGGWKLAEPLFSVYPDEYAVQDLRCKLAMGKGGAFAAAQAECAPLMRIVKSLRDKPRITPTATPQPGLPGPSAPPAKR